MRVGHERFSVEVYNRLLVDDESGRVEPTIEVMPDEHRILVNRDADLAEIVRQVGAFAAGFARQQVAEHLRAIRRGVSRVPVVGLTENPPRDPTGGE